MEIVFPDDALDETRPNNNHIDDNRNSNSNNRDNSTNTDKTGKSPVYSYSKKNAASNGLRKIAEDEEENDDNEEYNNNNNINNNNSSNNNKNNNNNNNNKNNNNYNSSSILLPISTQIRASIQEKVNNSKWLIDVQRTYAELKTKESLLERFRGNSLLGGSAMVIEGGERCSVCTLLLGTVCLLNYH